MNIRSKLLTILLLLFVGGVFSQSLDELKKIQKAYEEIIREKQAKEAISETMARDDVIIDEIPTQILVEPQDILAYYKLKIASMRTQLSDLQTLLPLIERDRGLNHYGYNYFLVRDTLSFWQNRPVTDDYPIGPGDDIIISLWGAAERYVEKTVNRDGTIFVNNVGLLYLGGKSLNQARKYIQSQYSKVYSTLVSKTPTTFMEVSLGKLKGINVHITGEVFSPGIHAVNPYATLTSILTQAGGIDTTGSLRNIIITRNGETVNSFDLYNFINARQKPLDIHLMDQDIIHIPVRESIVAIAGGVWRPAYYESLKNETVDDMLKFAGGLKPNAGLHLVVIHKHDQSLNSEIVSLDAAKEMIIHNGDSLFIPEIQISLQTVISEGPIASPGTYPWFLGMTVHDLLKISGGLYFGENSSAAFDKAVLIRHNQHDNGFSPIQIDINSIINGDENANFELKPFDRLSIPKKMDSKESYTALIVGEVAYPGRYPILSSSENLSSFINKTGGLLPTAFKEGITIERDTLQVGWLDENVVINHNDRIVVPKKPGLVQVLGSVNNPGYFSWEKGKSVRHYIKLAGGISSRGDKKTVYVKYANSRGAPASGLFNNPPVHEGASIFVSEKEIYKNEITYLDVLQTFASTVGSFATFLLLLRSL